MSWLIWKEYRLNRPVLIVGAVLLVVPHVFAVALARYGIAMPVEGEMSLLAGNLMLSGGWGLGLSLFTMGLLGGHIIACERADRSAEFQAYLPLARSRILTAKIALVLITLAALWLPNLLILYLTTTRLPISEDVYKVMASQILGSGVVAAFGCFSAAWFFSSFLESPTFAIGAGLIVPYLLFLGIVLVAWLLDCLDGPVGLWWLGSCLVLGCACFTSGTWYYLRRVEP